MACLPSGRWNSAPSVPLATRGCQYSAQCQLFYSVATAAWDTAAACKWKCQLLVRTDALCRQPAGEASGVLFPSTGLSIAVGLRMSSTRAWLVLAITTGLTAAGISYIHSSQKAEQELLHQGVVRDLERLAAKRAQLKAPPRGDTAAASKRHS
jgi:hypothetical protein